MYNDEELEEDLQYVMRDTTNTLERMIKDAPAELQKSAVSIDFVKETVKSVIDRYQKSFVNIMQKMDGGFKDPDTAEMASQIERQIKELEEIYDLEIEDKQMEAFMKQIRVSREDSDEKTEEVRTNKEEDLMTFMNESVHAFNALLQLDDIDSEIREINKTAVLESIEIYKRKYPEILEHTGGYYTNPNIMLKQSQIEQMIKRLESRYTDRENETELDIFDGPEVSSTKTEKNIDFEEEEHEREEKVDQRSEKQDELISFVDESFYAFDALLRLEDIDEDTHDIIKNAVSQSIQIYRNKYEQLLEQKAALSRDPNVMLKQNQIEEMIKRLETQYGIIQQEGQTNDNKSEIQETKEELISRLHQEYPLEEFQDDELWRESFENARLKSMGDLYEEFTRKYSLKDIQDSKTLAKKLYDMLNDGLDYSCDPKDTERVIRFEFLKHIVPQYSELRSVLITLRGINYELETQLFEDIDLSNISYQELLNKANAMIQEISQPEKIRPQEESIKDEIGDEFKPRMPEEKQQEDDAQIVWMNRLQLSDKTVDRVAEGAQDKREVVRLIQELEKQMSQDRNQQIQEENQNEGQR